MSKVTFAIIPLILIVLLSVFFFLSPNFLAKRTADSGAALTEIMVKRFMTVGNLISHATFVEDAIIMEETSKLNEIITQLRRDEPEIQFIHFTDSKNKVIASTDSALIGKTYSSSLLKSGKNTVKEEGGVFNGAFNITIGKSLIGALYFGAKPLMPVVKVTTSSNPIILVVGIIVGIITFFIMFAMQRNLEAKIVEDINKRQEEVFSPKIESLRKEQEKAQQEFDELNNQIAEARRTLEQLNEDYEARKREIEANPVMQSIEKLKESEAELLKRLEKLKEEEQQLNKEISLITQKREEVRSALEAEKKEERTLHEKLDLIKKKILHLETPKK